MGVLGVDWGTPKTIDFGVNRKAKAITCGSDHTCAILDDDTVKCVYPRSLAILRVFAWSCCQLDSLIMNRDADLFCFCDAGAGGATLLGSWGLRRILLLANIKCRPTWKLCISERTVRQKPSWLQDSLHAQCWMITLSSAYTIAQWRWVVCSLSGVVVRMIY